MARLDLKIMKARDIREDENWRIRQIQDNREIRENQLIEEILKKAPEILHWHLTEEKMLRDLLQHGQCSIKISHGEYNELKTRQKIKNAFNEFQTIVGPLLKVSFNHEKHRTEVTLEITK